MKHELNFTIQHLRSSSSAAACLLSQRGRYRAAFLEVDHFISPSPAASTCLQRAWEACIGTEIARDWVDSLFANVQERMTVYEPTDRSHATMLTAFDVGEHGVTIGHVGQLRVVVEQHGRVVFETRDHTLRWDEQVISDELRDYIATIEQLPALQQMGSIVGRYLGQQHADPRTEHSMLELRPPYRVAVVGSLLHGNRIASPISKVAAIVGSDEPLLLRREMALAEGRYESLSCFEETPRLPWWLALDNPQEQARLRTLGVEYHHLVLDVTEAPERSSSTTNSI